MEDTRLVFLGDASLATGFRLAGFQVYPDADVQQVDSVLAGLIAERSHAFVVLDETLARSGSKQVDAVRSEGGRILLTQVPPLTGSETMHSLIDDHIQQLLGLDGESA